MLNERKNIVHDTERNITYKPGDIILLLPLVSKGKNWDWLNLAKYLSNMNILLTRKLIEQYGEDNVIAKTMEKMFPYENIDKIMSSMLSFVDVRSLHIEIYLGGGWVINAANNGVLLHKMTIEDLRCYDVFRYKE